MEQGLEMRSLDKAELISPRHAIRLKLRVRLVRRLLRRDNPRAFVHTASEATERGRIITPIVNRAASLHGILFDFLVCSDSQVAV